MSREPVAVVSAIVVALEALIAALVGVGVLTWSGEQTALVLAALTAVAAVFGYGTPGSERLPYATARDRVYSEETVVQSGEETGDPHGDHS